MRISSFRSNTAVIVVSFCLLALIFVVFNCFSFIPSFYRSQSASADSNTTTTQLSLDPVIDLSVPSTIVLHCTPGITDSVAELCTSTANVIVSTNNITGYTLQMNTTNGYSNALTNQTISPSANVPSITTTYPVNSPNSFPINSWGYTGGSDMSSVTGGYNCTNDATNGNYCPILAYSSDPSSYTPNHTIRASSEPTETTTIPITFAGKVNTSIPSGTYVTSLTFTAVTNYIPNPITDNMYMQDIDSDVCKVTPPYSSTNKIYTVKDKRDETAYTVAKLADGNCWMTQNLELGEYGSPMNLTDELSDVGPDGYTLEFAYENNSIYKGNSNKYGNYYDYNQATAGSGTTTAGEDAPYSVCPKNWRLPSAGNADATGSEFYILLNQYITTGTWNNDHWEDITPSQYANVPLSFVFSGYMANAGGLYNLGYMGVWWSATSNGSFRAFALDAKTDGSIDPRGNYARGVGFSVRCLVNQ